MRRTMRRLARWLAVLGLLLMACPAVPAWAAESCELRVLWAEDPPYFIPSASAANGAVDPIHLR